jgi:hypothetical protein
MRRFSPDSYSHTLENQKKLYMCEILLENCWLSRQASSSPYSIGGNSAGNESETGKQDSRPLMPLLMPDDRLVNQMGELVRNWN